MERTIRYDVLCKDEKEKYYDVELQVARQEDLMERFRIYQSILDKHTIRKGEKEYIKVRETYIIFICDFDFFEDNLSVYNIKNICIENNKICEDKSNKIIINLKGNTEDREELKELVRLFKNSEYDVNNNQISKLAKRLEDIGNDEKFYGRYDVMQTIEGRLLEKGRAEGIKEGVEKVLISQVKVLKEFNVPEEEIKERIIKEFKLTKEEIEKYFK